MHHVTRFSNLAANIPVAYDYAASPHAEELYKGDYELHTRTLVHAVGPGRATVAPIAARTASRSWRRTPSCSCPARCPTTP
ncbi:hypothetical protein ACR6C2_01935 [Streptomyces sp. INA 01156]